MKYFLFIFLLLGLSHLQAKTRFDREIEQRRRELNQLKKEVESQRKEIDKIQDKEKGALGNLELVKQDISKTLSYIDALERNKILLDSSLVDKKYQIDSLQREVLHTQNILKKKIRILYKRGEPDYASLLLKAESSREILEDWILMKRLMVHDRRLIQNLDLKTKVLEEAKGELEVRTAEIDENAEQSKKEKERLRKKELEEAKWLKNLKRDRALMEQALEEYKGHQNVLLSLIEDLEKKRQAEEKRLKEALASKNNKPPKRKKMGKACSPVDGKIVSEFGMQMHPVLKTKTRNLGVEIESSKNAEVRAAQPGVIAKIIQLPGRGLSIIIDHENSYYSVYGGLGKVFVKQGQKVRSCQEIATIARVTSQKKPQLYFQISKGVKTINPRHWLD